MRSLFYKYCIVAFVILFLITVGTSCEKENDENSRTTPTSASFNRAPLANAGSDQTIILPQDDVILDGSASIDTENNISKPEWQKISGPSSFSISDATALTTAVSNLIEGNYEFELKIMDVYGLFSKDTITVTVLVCATEYDLDETINCHYSLVDNFEDCSDYPYLACSYYDAVDITGYFSSPTNTQFQVGISERTDTAASNQVFSTYAGISLVGQTSIHRYIWGGCSPMKIGELIENGGGIFSGTLQPLYGSAQNCIPPMFSQYPSLSITGTIDTAARSVTLRIAGKVYM